jgi:hypothetical protein
VATYEVQPNTVHVLMWTHKHGVDIFVHTSEESAVRHAARLVTESLNELDSDDSAILETLAASPWSGIIRYCEKTEETFEVLRREVEEQD